MSVLVDSVNTTVEAWEVLYTATEDVNVSAFAATNIADHNVWFKCAIVSGEIREIINHQIIVRKKSNEGWQLVGQTIPKGATLQFQSSHAGGVHFYVSG